MRSNTKKQRGIVNQLRTDITGYAFIAPNLLFFIIFVAFPFLFSLFTSFTDWEYTAGFSAMQFNGGAHFINMWKDKWFTDSLLNTFYFVIGTVPPTIFLSMVLAYVIDRYVRSANSIKLLMFIPYISNIVAVSVVWAMLYSPFGPISQMVRNLGFEPPYWLADYNWALPSIIIMSIWLSLGYAIMIYSAAIKGISKDLFEAADIDGVGPVALFRHIVMPMLSHTTFFLFVTLFIMGFKVFGQIFVMTQGGPGTSTQVLVYYIYTTAFRYFKMGYASAISWILFIILFCITLAQWGMRKRWEH